MRHYTTTEQTAHLMELGFEKPMSMNGEHNGWQFMPTPAYSIGELIEMLPENSSKRIRYVATKRAWIVDVDVLGKSGVGKCYRGTYHPRLIDALYDMCVKLKAEGVI